MPIDRKDHLADDTIVRLANGRPAQVIRSHRAADTDIHLTYMMKYVDVDKGSLVVVNFSVIDKVISRPDTPMQVVHRPPPTGPLPRRIRVKQR